MSQKQKFRPMKRYAIVTIGLALLGVMRIGFAQESQAVTPAPAKPAVASLEQIEEIFIPAELLSVVMTQDQAAALLSRDEYEKLVASARAAESGIASKIDSPVIGATQYDATLSGPRLEVNVTSSVTTFRPNSEVLLRIGSWNVESATLNGEPAPLSRRPNDLSQLRLFVAKPGTHAVKLKLSMPFQTVGSDQLAQVVLLGESHGEFKLTIPAGKSLMANGLTLPRPAALDQKADYVIPVGGQSQLSLLVTDRTQASRSDSLTFANTVYGLRLLPGEVAWSTATQLQVFGRKLDQVVCFIPRTLEIKSIQSEGLESWTLDDDAAHPTETKVTLKYRLPFDGERKIGIQGLLSPGLGQVWSVPHLKLDQVTTHTGMLLIWLPEQLRLQLLEQNYVRSTLPPAALANSSEGVPSLAFEVWRDDFTLSFQTSLKESTLQAAMTNILLIEETGLELLSTVTIQPQRDPVFEVRLRLPTEYRVKDVTKDGESVGWVSMPADAGLQDVRVLLPDQVPPGKTLTLNLRAENEPEHWLLQKKPATVPVPAVKLLQAGMVELLYGICAPSVLEVSPIEITGLDPASRAEMESLNERLQKAGEHLRLGFSGQEMQFKGQLQISRRPGGLTVQTVSLFQVDRETVTSQLESQLSVSGGGLRTIDVQVTESAGDKIRFSLVPLNAQSTVAKLMEQVPGEVMNGLRSWTLTCDRPLRGDYLLKTTVSLPRGTEAEFSPASLRFPQAISQSGFIAVAGSEDEQVKIVAKGADGQPLQVIDPIDFPVAKDWQQRRLVAGYGYAQPGWSLQATVSQFARGSVPPAIGHELKLASTWGEGSDIQNLAELSFNAVGMQSLSVKLPEAARLWSVLLDGQPIETRQGGDGVTIPLSQLNPKEQHRLNLLYETTSTSVAVAESFNGVPPLFSVTTGAGVEQTLPVLQQEWTLHSPTSTVIMKAVGPYQTAAPLPTGSWRERTRELLRTISLGEILPSGVVLFFVLMIYLLLRTILSPQAKKYWEGIFVATFLLCLTGYLLLLPAVQQSREAARYSAERYRQKQLSLEMESKVQSESQAPPSPVAAPAPKAAMPEMRKLEENASDLSGKGMPQAEPKAQAVKARDLDGKGAVDKSEKLAVPTEPRLTVRQNGILSLPATLQIPTDTFSQQFFYRGNLPPGEQVALQVKLAPRTTTKMVQLALAMAIVLLGWIVRTYFPRIVPIWLFMTVVIPIALLGFATGWESVINIGILTGGLLTIAVWLVHALGQTLETIWSKVWQRRAARAVQGAVLLAVLLNGTTAFAEKPASTIAPASPRPFVVVPYESLEKVSSADRVFVPADLFQRLWTAAHPEEVSVNSKSLPASIAEAIYRAEPVADAVGNRLKVEARWVVVNPSNVAQTIALPVRGVTLEEVRIGDSAAPVTAGGDGLPLLVLPKQGVQIVDARFSLPLELTKDAGQFNVDFTPVGAGTLTLMLPKATEPRRIRVNGGTNQFQKIDQDASQQISIPIDRGDRFSVAWQPERQKQESDALLLLTGELAVTVTDVGLNQNQNYKLTVRQGTTSECRFELPKGLAVRRLTGADVAGWEISNEGDSKQQLKVLFRRQVNDETSFDVELFQALDSKENSQSISLLTLQSLGMNRETGVIGIGAPPELRVQQGESSGLQQIDTKTFPKEKFTLPSADSSIFCYRYTSVPFNLKLQLERRSGQLRANVEQGIRVGLRKISVASKFVLNVTETPRRQFEFTLPEGYLPLDVNCAHCTDWFVTPSNGMRKLTVELDQPRTGQIEVGLEGEFSRTSAPQPLTLGVPTIEADHQSTHVGVWFDSSEQGAVTESGKWISISPEELPLSIRKLSSQPVNFAFRTTTEPSPLVFDVSKNLPELQVDTAILIAVGDATVDYGFTFRWNVTNSATETFAFLAPSWLGQLEFQTDGVRQIRSEPAEQGYTRWIITVLQPKKDHFLITAAASVALPADQLIKAPQLRMLSMSGPNPFADLQHQQQFAVLVNLSSNQLSPAEPAKIEIITAQDLPLKLPTNLVQQATEIVRVREGAVPAWRIQRSQRIEGARAVVLSGSLTTVLQPDGSWRTRAIYGVRNRGQQFLALRLPEGAEILSVLVRDQPSRTVLTTLDEKPIQLIPLPQTSAADLSFDVTLILAGQLPQALPKRSAWWGRSVSIPAPNILSPQDSEEFGVSTAQTLWNVYVPEGLDAVPETGNGASNVTWHQGNAWLEAEMQTLNRFRSDLSELKRIAGGTDYSSSQRIQATQNIGRLQKQLESQQSFVRSERGRSDISDRITRENELLLNEAVESSKNAIIGDSRPQAGEKTEIGNRAFITSNNSAVLSVNSAGVEKKSEVQEEMHRFNVPLGDRRSGAKQKADESRERSLLRSQLSQQDPLVARGNVSPVMSGGMGGMARGVGGGMGGGMGEANQISPPSSSADTPATQVMDSFRRRSSDSASSSLGIVVSEPVSKDSQQQTAAPPKWTSAGGLSVPVDLPISGHELAFSRVGGSPELVLKISGGGWADGVRSLIWAALWLIAGAWILRRGMKAAIPDSGTRLGLLLLILIGAVGFLLISGTGHEFFLVLVCGSAFIVLLQTACSRCCRA